VITTRDGGYSQGNYFSYNLATHVDDNPAHVQSNREGLLLQCAREFGAAPDFHWLTQTHGTHVAPLPLSRPIPEVDAAYTTEPGQACVVLTADCLPVLICDANGREVAAAHAGWRGLAAGILSNTVSCFAARPGSLIAYLGPAISQAAFEVGEDVRQAFVNECERFGGARRVDDAFQVCAHTSGKSYADLYTLARPELHALGIDAVYGLSLIHISHPTRPY